MADRPSSLRCSCPDLRDRFHALTPPSSLKDSYRQDSCIGSWSADSGDTFRSPFRAQTSCCSAILSPLCPLLVKGSHARFPLPCTQLLRDRSGFSRFSRRSSAFGSDRNRHVEEFCHRVCRFHRLQARVRFTASVHSAVDDCHCGRHLRPSRPPRPGSGSQQMKIST